MATVAVNHPRLFRTNFASRASDRARLINVALYGGALIVLAVTGVQLWGALTDRHTGATMRENLVRVHQLSTRLQSDLRAVGFAAGDPGAAEDLTKRVAALNLILEQKSFSWSAFLTDLEATVPKLVSIASIQPELGGGTVTLQGTALTLQNLTAFMIALEESPGFADVFLKQQRTNEEGVVEFSIQCSYRRTR